MKTNFISESEYLKLEQVRAHFKSLAKGASSTTPVLALDSVSGFPVDIVDYSLRLENSASVSSFNIFFNNDASAPAVARIDDTTPRAVKFEYFSHQLDDNNIQLRVLIYSLDWNHLPAVSKNFMTVKNNADFEISDMQRASEQGQLMEVSYSAVSAIIPESYYLSADYPNRLNPETKMGFHLSRTALIELSDYYLLGQRVNTLVESVLSPGEYSVSWDGRDYQGNSQPAGVYFYPIDSEAGSLKRQTELVK